MKAAAHSAALSLGPELPREPPLTSPASSARLRPRALPTCIVFEGVQGEPAEPFIFPLIFSLDFSH